MSRIPGSGRTLRCPFATTWLQQARLDSPACDSPSDLLTCSVSVPSEIREEKTAEDPRQRPQLPAQVKYMIANIRAAQLHSRLITSRSSRARPRSSA